MKAQVMSLELLFIPLLNNYKNQIVSTAIFRRVYEGPGGRMITACGNNPDRLLML